MLPMAKRDSKPKPDPFEDDEEDEAIHSYLKSEQFQKDFRKAIEADTWEKGHPMYYMDKEGWLVEHWKDGKIVRKKKLQ
jgi:hypothetical protein